MDYAGSNARQLNKYQWDLIHDPDKVWFSWLQDEKEGASQLWSDRVCTQKFIEQFRWAYVNKKKLVYEADGYPWFGHFAEDMMLDGTTFENITVEVRQDLGFIPSKTNYEQVYSRAVFNYGKVLSITTLDKFTETENYLFPSKEDWDKQINDLITKVNTATTRREFLKELAVLPYQEYSRFSATERVSALNFIMQGSITEDKISCRNDEEIVINLIKYTPDEQLEKLFYGLQQTELMQTLCSKIQNAFGEENYTKFVGALTSCFMRYRKDDMAYVLNNWKDYTSEQSRNNKITHFVWNREFSSDRRITYRKHYEINKIIIKTWPGGMFDIMDGDVHSYTRPPLDPFDIVTVYFRTPPKHVSEEIPADVWLAMPAFMFEWYLNEFHNKQIAAHLDGAVTIASFVIPAGAMLSKGAKALIILNASIGAINVALLSDKITTIVEDYLSESALSYWNDFAFLWTVAESPFQDIVLEKYLQGTTSFFMAWNAFKSSDNYNYLMSDETSKEAIVFMESLMDNIKPLIEE